MSLFSNVLPGHRLCLKSAILLAISLPATAAQEPFGPEIAGFRITQEASRGKVVCRATAPGENVLGRRGDGNYYVSMPAGSIPNGKYPETSFSAGTLEEPVSAKSDGGRFGMEIHDKLVAQIVRTGSFKYRVMVGGQIRSGGFNFGATVGQAVTRLRECTKANGGV